MKFYQESIHADHEALTAVRAIYRWYGVKFRLRWDSHESHSSPSDGEIQIGLVDRGGDPMTVQEVLSAALHELSHVFAYQSGKYIHYHSRHPFSDVRGNILAIKTAVRAEHYVDREAKKMMEIFFPGIPHKKSYTKKAVLWFKEEWLAQWKLALAEYIAEKGTLNVLRKTSQ